MRSDSSSNNATNCANALVCQCHLVGWIETAVANIRTNFNIKVHKIGLISIYSYVFSIALRAAGDAYNRGV